MSNLLLWSERSPLAEFDELVRRTFGSPVSAWPSVPSGFRPASEVARDGDDAVIRVELPGVDVEKDVTVEVSKDQLVVRGERRDDRSEQRGRMNLREVRYGQFRRSFTLPAHVKADAVSASYDAGVLTVRVAGAYGATDSDAHRIPVTVAAAAVRPAGEQSA
jgi:HSP20 family protein